MTIVIAKVRVNKWTTEDREGERETKAKEVIGAIRNEVKWIDFWSVGMGRERSGRSKKKMNQRMNTTTTTSVKVVVVVVSVIVDLTVAVERAPQFHGVIVHREVGTNFMVDGTIHGNFLLMKKNKFSSKDKNGYKNVNGKENKTVALTRYTHEKKNTIILQISYYFCATMIDRRSTRKKNEEIVDTSKHCELTKVKKK